MGKIFCIIGKSSSGKDTVYKRLLQDESLVRELNLKKIILYTTRPIREGEREGVEYHFVSCDDMERLRAQGKIIECRSYETVCGTWHYFMANATANDSEIDLEKNNYLVVGTLESYLNTRKYFGADNVVCVYIDLDDGERLTRAIEREKRQKEPKYNELCRRFLADANDFAPEKLAAAGVTKAFDNSSLDECVREIEEFLTQF